MILQLLCFNVFVIVLIWILRRDDLAKSMTVTPTESSGLRQKVGMRFVELPSWSKRNLGKTPPAASCEKIAVLQADGSKVAKDGVWELDRGSSPLGGEHLLERL